MEIKESERELSRQAQNNPSLRLPLRFLNAMRTTPILGIDDLAHKLGVSRDKLVKWATLYEIGGAALLLDHRVHLNRHFVDQVLRQNSQKVNNPRSVARELENNRPNHWSQLPQEMQSLLLSKIKSDKPEKSVSERFNEMVQGNLAATVDNKIIKDRITTVKNFIAVAGGHKNSALWNQIKEITFIDVNQLAVHSSQPSMHFANDKGGDIYFVHWDPTSTSIRNGSIKTGNLINDFIFKQAERIAAGKAHGNKQLSPDRIREDIRSRKLIPDNVE
jgi:hypothetical protein